MEENFSKSREKGIVCGVHTNLQMDIMLVMKILVLCMARDLPVESSLYPPYTIS